MKKRKAVISIFVSGLLFLSGCGEYPGVEITTSDGKSIVACGGYSQQVAVRDSIEVKAASAKVHFFCVKCDYDEMLELTSPGAKIFKCNCKWDPGFAAVELHK